MNNQTSESQMMEMCEGESIEYLMGQVTGVFLSRQHLEKLIENYIQNTLVRTVSRTFRKGSSNILTTRYDGDFRYKFNERYVPTTRECDILHDLKVVASLSS